MIRNVSCILLTYPDVRVNPIDKMKYELVC